MRPTGLRRGGFEVLPVGHRDKDRHGGILTRRTAKIALELARAFEEERHQGTARAAAVASPTDATS